MPACRTVQLVSYLETLRGNKELDFNRRGDLKKKKRNTCTWSGMKGSVIKKGLRRCLVPDSRDD